MKMLASAAFAVLAFGFAAADLQAKAPKGPTTSTTSAAPARTAPTDGRPAYTQSYEACKAMFGGSGFAARRGIAPDPQRVEDRCSRYPHRGR
jgi:hypothetical protein